MEILCAELELSLVPLLSRGIYQADGTILKADGTTVKLLDLGSGQSQLGGIQEGMVMRVARSFRYDEYGTVVAKYVRANHVTTDEHWMFQAPVENILES
jgi:hypothetical protein